MNEVILHQVSKGGAKGQGGTATLSETVAPLDDANRTFIQTRLKNMFSAYAHQVVEEPGQSEAPAIIRRYLQEATSASLIEASQELAKLLQAKQPNVSPSGIFLVASVQVPSGHAIALAKVENEQGVRTEQTQGEDGKLTFSIQYLRDLMFTSTAKVYKSALFAAADISNSLLYGQIVDKQGSSGTVARYFLDSYMGCRLVEKPEVITQRFYSEAHKWINRGDNGEKKARYQVALLSEMQSNRPNLSINEFASNHLETEDRDEFVTNMISKGVPQRRFDKAIDLVRTSIQKVKIETEEGVLVLAPPVSLSDGTVTIRNTADGVSEVRITGKVTKVSGAGPVSLPTNNISSEAS
ncbi:nucleoid-associated protein [Planobispora rosea]|uniref:nucleoid-associated protein n=1 Tax=Planobispora rosea TaxID=35762 RepID=UPI00159F2284|nr:nucleoid-associated protein [Planobispora rosea]